MPVTIAIKDINVMSQAQFRKLRSEGFEYLSAEKETRLVDGIKFVAMFTSTVAIKNVKYCAIFYVQEGDEKIVTISKGAAQKLNLIKD